MNKPAYLNPMWSFGHAISVEEIETDLNIKWENIDDYTVKRERIYIKMKTGEILQFDFELNVDIDKWPTSVIEFDEKFNKIRETEY